VPAQMGKGIKMKKTHRSNMILIKQNLSTIIIYN